VFTAGDGPPSRLHPDGSGTGDDCIDIPGLYQAAERRNIVKLVTLGSEPGGLGFDDFRDFFR
jgi:hypothetical protein